ncbi:pre-rRNA-processing TSR1-like protein [Perilla frutescens var. hirtella]|uniref:Pre-rRNA-processing TSR1-like protein n=1 Tax=Perilla frutescens var. hirtella TaxID=608512 RepID=A0AAD4P011_PERFH|nr:pre-rRNA-processing TSR1-like protein [Perilla frutescens var. hirtella]
MGGSRHQLNKSHKTRFASKSSRNVHKISSQDKRKISKSDRSVAKGAKAARLQRNKMMREQKRAAVLKEKRALSGPTSPPRVIVLFGLTARVNLNAVEEDILSLLSEERNTTTFPAVASSEYKLRATVLKAPHGDLVTCMEMAKVADLLAFVASPNSSQEADDTDSFIDSFGSQCLSVFRTLGLPSTAVLIRDLPVDLKRKHELKKTCMSVLASEFPEDCKFFPADEKDELHKFISLLKELRLTVPHWRSQRSYLMAQKVDMVSDDTCSPETCTLVLTGYLRAHSLSVNQLVHVSGAGDFQLSKIEVLRDPCPLNLRKGVDLMDSESDTQVETCLTPDPMKQEPLAVENALDLLAGEQTWPTEAEMAEADRNHKEKKMKKKKLPRGISEYQAAWIVDDSDVDYSDSDEGEDDGMVLDDGESGFPDHKVENGSEFDEDQVSLNLRDSDEETETESVLMDADNLTKEQIAEQIRKIKEDHAEDEEFPDEVDTPIDVPARKRFAKYRGVKSFRTSTWDPKESLPPEYARIFAFDNFARTQKHVLAKALDLGQETDGCIPSGAYVRLYVKDVSAVIASKLCALSEKMPIIASGLLQHESKISVLHFSIRKHDSYDAPIKAKEELLFHVGFRQFISRPIYSSDSINANKHKMERFLHAGRFSVASIYAPICFPSLPLIALKSQGDGTSPAVAAVGSLRSVDPDRIVLKKIILTGYPQRVSKSKATVRYMFHNPEDVKWFKPVEVWSKCGRRGRIREPVGTHGAMKCILNGVLQQHDTVCMSLFKRTYPKWPQQWFPLQSGSD